MELACHGATVGRWPLARAWARAVHPRHARRLPRSCAGITSLKTDIDRFASQLASEVIAAASEEERMMAGYWPA